MNTPPPSHGQRRWDGEDLAPRSGRRRSLFYLSPVSVMARRYSRSGLKLLQADMMRVLNPAFLAIEDEQDPVANASALATFDDVGLTTGYVKPLQSVRDLVSLDRESVDPIDGITVFSTKSGVGRWVRLVVRHPHWSSQAAWEIDPTSGNDENDGTPGHPLKTWAEFTRRVWLVSVPMTVTILGSLSEPLRGTFETISSTVYLLVAFRPTVLASGTASTFVDPSSGARGTVTVTDLTLAGGGAADFSNFVGKMIRSDLNVDGYRYAQVFKAASPTVANVGFWSRYLSTTKPTNGALVEVLDLPTVPTVAITTLGGLPVEVRGCNITSTWTQPGDYPMINALRPVSRLEFSSTSVVRCCFHACIFNSSVLGSHTWFFGCFFSQDTRGASIFGHSGNYGGSTFSGGGSLRPIDLLAPGRTSLQAFTVQGAQLTFGAYSDTALAEGGGVSALSTSGSVPICVYDSPGDGVYVRNGAQLTVSTLWGSGNTGYGVQVDNGGFMRVTGGPPSITGTAGEVRLDGAGTAIPPLTAGAAVPAAAPLTTWAQWAAAPFNRYVFSYKTGSRILGA